MAPRPSIWQRIARVFGFGRPAALPDSAPIGGAVKAMRADGYINHPGHGVTPRRVVEIFRQAECGQPQMQCDLFDDLIETDGHLRSLLEQRAQSVAGKPWVVVPAEGDEGSKLAARIILDALRRLPMVDVLEHQLTFNTYGWAATEIDWGTAAIDGRIWIVPKWLGNVPARRFRIDPATNELRLATEEKPGDGEALIPGKWLVTRRSGTSLARAALMRTAAWLSVFKKFSTRDWVIYAEKYGLPLTLAKYGDAASMGGSTDDDSRLAAVDIVRNIGNDGGAVVPKSVDVEIHEAGRNGDSSGVHGGVIGFCNAEMSKLVNGSTLANDNAGSGGASYALGEVHASSRWDNIQADAKRIQESFRLQLFEAFMRFNGLTGPSALLEIQVVRDLEPRQRVEIADIFVNKLGGKASLTQLGQEAGMKPPLDEADTARGAVKAEPKQEAVAA